MSVAGPWAETVTIADGHHGVADGGQITGVMIEACSRYLTDGIGLSQDETFREDSRPIVAETHVRYRSIFRVGDAHRCAVRAADRTAKGFGLDVEVTRADDATPVAVGQVRFVQIDPSAGRSIEIPASLWGAIERTEGRSIPVS